MNWKRIIMYSLLVAIIPFLCAFLWGGIGGFINAALNDAAGKQLPRQTWFNIGYLLVALVTIAIFARLTIIQKEKTFAHALAVVLVGWILSFPGKTLQQWLVWIVPLIVVALIGVLIGKGLQR